MNGPCEPWCFASGAAYWSLHSVPAFYDHAAVHRRGASSSSTRSREAVACAPYGPETHPGFTPGFPGQCVMISSEPPNATDFLEDVHARRSCIISTLGQSVRPPGHCDGSKAGGVLLHSAVHTTPAPSAARVPAIPPASSLTTSQKRRRRAADAGRGRAHSRAPENRVRKRRLDV